MKIKFGILILVIVCNFTRLDSAFAQGRAFTYQGRLLTTNGSAQGRYDFTFALYDASSGGSQFGGTFQTNGVAVTNGLFTVVVDFGAGLFDGTAYWLQIGVRTNDAPSFTPLSGRQPVTPEPYALYAESGNAAGLTGTVPAASLSGTYNGAISLNNAGNNFSGDGSGLTGVNAAELNGLTSASLWQTTGNAGTTAGLNYVGTRDVQPLELRVDGARAVRIEPGTFYVGQGLPPIPNIIGGSQGNFVAPSSVGNFIGGGGEYLEGSTNFIDAANYNVIGGGWNNHIINYTFEATIGGGKNNTVADDQGTVGGGFNNSVTGAGGTVPGGYNNLAAGQYSFAAGHNAQALNDGSFVWADDSNGTAFASAGPNQFLVRAFGGVGVNTNDPAGAALNVAGTVRAAAFQGDGSGLFNVPEGVPGNYVFAYNNGVQSVAVGNVFQDINFSTDAQLNGWMHASGTAQYTNAQTGLYLVQYYGQVSTTAANGTNAQLRVTLNGLEIAGSRSAVTLSALNQFADASKSLIASANAGDVLTVQFTGSGTGIRLSGSGNTTLTITRIH
jgi:hypothetical protein